MKRAIAALPPSISQIHPSSLGGSDDNRRNITFGAEKLSPLSIPHRYAHRYLRRPLSDTGQRVGPPKVGQGQSSEDELYIGQNNSRYSVRPYLLIRADF